MRFLVSVLVFCSMCTAASAQDKSSTILVLDGSGSMWGQIDGKAKITIAQEVIGDLLTNLPEQQQLGLTVYGHRRKGDCADIETLVTPGGDTRDAIRGSVNAIKPKGKTPMTDAVIAAAQSLRYTEERATVILVSDGIETCHPDPCAAARTLEEAGVDFTAHVVGFNIDDPEAIAQMQCLADETGGTFRSAENAAELSEALVFVAAPPEPEPAPEPVVIKFQATLGKGGPLISSGLVWSFSPEGTGAQTEPTGQTDLELMSGEYTVSVLRLEDETSVDAAFTVGKADKIVTLVLPEIEYRATLEAVDNAAVGSTIEVTWDAEVGDNDFVAIAVPGAQEGQSVGYSYIKTGNPVDLTVALQPGEYELRYFRSAKGRHELLATRPITLTDIVVTLDAKAEIGAGNNLPVAWDGPNYQNDYITIVPTGAKDDVYKNYAYARKGSPAEVKAPLEPGTYEIRYVANGNPNRVMARRAITVVQIPTSLEAPDEAAAGASVEVIWEGPNNQGDFISIAAPDQDAQKYANYAYTKSGSPAALTMPLDPGVYELRYIAKGNPDMILATRAINVVDVLVTLVAAPEAVAGSLLDVTWAGPDNKNDYISVAAPDQDPQRYINYAYTSQGMPAGVKMPLDPGQYELRYVANGNPDKVLATRPVTVVAATVALDAPDEAVAGTIVDVAWNGPDNQNDYLSVAADDQDPQKYVNYAYTSRGTPAKVTMPLDPGNYQLRYIANGNPDQILATRNIRIVAAVVSIDAPTTAQAGAKIDVNWEGPDNKGDFVAIADTGADARKYHNYRYTSNGNPSQVSMPLEPGDYQLRYVANGNPNKILATAAISIVKAEVALDAPELAVVATSVDVFYVGPNNGNDYVAIAEIGSEANEYSHYQYTNRGNPVTLKLPEAPGTYLIRYVAAGNPPKILKRRSITVVEASADITTAQLEASDSAAAGSETEVFWVGPDADGDRITISKIGSDDALSEAETSAGNPVMLKMPDATGNYLLRYISAAEGRAIGIRPITAN